MATRCHSDVKCGAEPGQACNEDAAAGALVPCRNGLCVDGRCTVTCAADDDCTWRTALECAPIALFASYPDFDVPICSGIVCIHDEDCLDTAELWCRPRVNDAADEPVGYCARTDERTPCNIPEDCGFPELLLCHRWPSGSQADSAGYCDWK